MNGFDRTKAARDARRRQGEETMAKKLMYRGWTLIAPGEQEPWQPRTPEAEFLSFKEVRELIDERRRQQAAESR